MADLPNDFWSGWITVLTLVSLAALCWIVISIFFFSNREKETAHDAVVWDGNLKEGAAAPPLWWFWLILATVIFSLVYLILYPGLGSFKGVLNWSQDSRLESSQSHYTSSFAQKRQDIANSPLERLANDASLMRSAESIFSRNCATCHGYDAAGQAKLFPDLKDADWQWGGTEEDIRHTIVEGRIGQMPGFKGILDDKEINQVAKYVLNIATSDADNLPGKTKYEQACAVCHGKDGKGNPLLGAPNLADNIWLYGKDEDDILLTIRQGRNGEMPAFGDRLDDTQLRLLIAWLSK